MLFNISLLLKIFNNIISNKNKKSDSSAKSDILSMLLPNILSKNLSNSILGPLNNNDKQRIKKLKLVFMS